MRTIIAGSRTNNNIKDLIKAIDYCNWPITSVITGKARGVDHLGELWASYHKIPIIEFPANWKKFGKSAGYKRNKEMADNADALIALWNGKSRGTKSMIELAITNKLLVFVEMIDCDG
jgi:hypothetical protein